MEHIVQFAVSVDDNRIQEIMEQSAAAQIANDIKLAAHGTRGYGGYVNEKPENLRELFQEEIAKFVAEHADEIISAAVTEVSRNLMKTKKVKEALANLTEE